MSAQIDPRQQQQTASPDEMPREIPLKVERLTRIAEEFEAKISHLEERLTPILNAAGIGNEANKTSGAPHPVMTPLASDLHALGSRLVDQYDRLGRIIDRIEL